MFNLRSINLHLNWTANTSSLHKGAQIRDPFVPTALPSYTGQVSPQHSRQPLNFVILQLMETVDIYSNRNYNKCESKLSLLCLVLTTMFLDFSLSQKRSLTKRFQAANGYVTSLEKAFFIFDTFCILHIYIWTCLPINEF